MAYTKYSLTPADNNAAPPNGAPEGMLPSAVNDTMRDMMSQIRDVGDGIRNGTYPFGAGTVSAPSITTTGDTNTGIFFPAADTIAFTEGGVESMRIDSSGNVGIGVTPASWGVFKVLQVSTIGSVSSADFGSGNTQTRFGSNIYYDGANFKYITNNPIAMYTQNGSQHIWTYAASGTANATVTPTEAMRIDSSGNVGIGTSSPTSITNYRSITMNGTTGSLFDIQSNGTTGGRIQCDTTYPGMALFTLTTQPMVFGTSQLERMRIDSSGNLLVGTTSTPSSSNAGVLINPAAAFDTVQISRGSGTNSRTMISFINGNGTVGAISTNGSSTSYNTSSDYRLKENIAPMTGALSVVQQLKPCTYRWKSSGEDSQGFIAHELQAVVPDCVTGEKDAVDAEGKPKYQGIDTSFLVATLTAAIQEQQALIQNLTTRLNALEGK